MKYWTGKSLIEKTIYLPDVQFGGILSAAKLWNGSGSEYHKGDQQAFKLHEAKFC